MNVLKAKQIRPRLSPERYDGFLQWEKRVSEGLDGDSELIEENVRLAKQKQRLQDMNRIERKSWREQTRYENAVSAYGKSLVEEMQKYGKGLTDKINLNPLVKVDRADKCGVIQLTDLHGNEEVNMPNNKYNFTVLSKRLKKLIDESLKYFEFRGVNRVLFTLTGDLLNSDRRLEELMAMSTNRSKASVLMAHLITQAILDVRNRGYEVSVVSVLGNESRVNQEMSFSNESISDSYDFTIVSMAKIAIEAMNVKGITFLSIDQMETVVQIGSQHWLVTHDVAKVTSSPAKTQSTMGRFAWNGTPINYIIGGHLHSANITDVSARSGSMVGSNAYSEHSLNMAGRASGICYSVEGNDRFSQYIDLQHADNEGYEVESKLIAYNVKSHAKTKDQTVIFKVVI